MSLLWFVPAGALLALGFSVFLIISIFKQPAGNKKMQEIAGYVSEGAKGYLKQQYKVVSIFFIVVFFLLILVKILCCGCIGGRAVKKKRNYKY